MYELYNVCIIYVYAYPAHVHYKHCILYIYCSYTHTYIKYPRAVEGQSATGEREGGRGPG